jgi:hypothetical protein
MKVASRPAPAPAAIEKPAPAKAEVAQETSREEAPNRVLKQRARVAASRPPKAVARANADEETRAAPATRRPVRMARAARTVRGEGGSLEGLLDDFSRSGSDFMHERTFRLGRGYLIERTTPNGTRYFYERSASAY